MAQGYYDSRSGIVKEVDRKRGLVLIDSYPEEAWLRIEDVKEKE